MVLLFDIFTNDKVLFMQFSEELARYGDTKLVSEPQIFGTNYFVLLAFGGCDSKLLIDNLKDIADKLSSEREKETGKVSMMRFCAFRITECIGSLQEDVKDWLENYLNNNC